MKTNKRILDLARNVLEGHRGGAFQEFRAVVVANGYDMSRGGWVKFGGEHVTRGWESFAYMVSETKEIILTEPAEAEEVQRETEARETATAATGWNRVIELAHPVSEGGERSDVEALKAAVAPYGYHGAAGLGILNAASDPVASSWRSFAVAVIQGEVWGTRVTREVPNEGTTFSTDAVKENPFPYPTRGLIPAVDAILDARDITEPAEVEVTFLYATRTPTVRLADMTLTHALITEERSEFTEGQCQSGAALNCTGTGFLQVLPESLLPGHEREDMIQCAPCHEASGAAYVRKLHHYATTPEDEA